MCIKFSAGFVQGGIVGKNTLGQVKRCRGEIQCLSEKRNENFTSKFSFLISFFICPVLPFFLSYTYAFKTGGFSPFLHGSPFDGDGSRAGRISFFFP